MSATGKQVRALVGASVAGIRPNRLPGHNSRQSRARPPHSSTVHRLLFDKTIRVNHSRDRCDSPRSPPAGCRRRMRHQYQVPRSCTRPRHGLYAAPKAGLNDAHEGGRAQEFGPRGIRVNRHRVRQRSTPTASHRRYRRGAAGADAANVSLGPDSRGREIVGPRCFGERRVFVLNRLAHLARRRLNHGRETTMGCDECDRRRARRGVRVCGARWHRPRARESVCADSAPRGGGVFGLRSRTRRGLGAVAARQKSATRLITR